MDWILLKCVEKRMFESEIELEDCGSVGVETLRVHFGE